jgi:hypothetical protein
MTDPQRKDLWLPATSREPPPGRYPKAMRHSERCGPYLHKPMQIVLALDLRRTANE